MAEWPGGARGALCLSFDNLGEAAAIELGAIAADDPTVGVHPTVTRTLPSVLAMLAEHELAATFFVEGLNAELYPEALKAISSEGHEVAYHAWRHEQWGDLSAEEQAENLAHGLAAFGELDLEVAGLRPPGGQLGRGGVGVLREAGLRYASPAGAGVGIEDEVALIPFQWRHVDATCVLPGLAPLRERISGSPDPLGPAAFLAHLEAEIDDLAASSFISIVLHLSLLEWLGEDGLAALLDRLAIAGENGLWATRCADVAAHILAHPDELPGAGITLDSTSWAG